MSSKKTLKQILDESKGCFLVPCVYDCASNHAVEMCGFPVSLLSGGETSIAMNGVIDYGFTGLTDLEWVVSRVSQTSSIPLIADIEDGFGGPLAVYRSARRLSRAGAAAIQLEDSADMEESTRLLPREKYLAKVRAALDALEGTDCLLIARSNADRLCPPFLREKVRLVRTNLFQAVTGSFDIITAEKGPDGKYRPSVTMEELTELGFVMCSTHYTLKAAMEGMLEHGLQNYKNQDVTYTFSTAPATGMESFSASGMFDPQAYMKLENRYTSGDKEYTIVGHKVEDYPEGFVRPDVKERL